MRRNLSLYKVVLVALITSLTITGIGFIDDKIWNIIMIVIGMLAYSIVGILYSLKIISGKDGGKEAYAAVFIVLLLLGYCVYQGIVAFQAWLLSWPLAVKIIVPTVMILCIALFIFLVLKNKKKESSEIKSVE